MLYLLTYCSQLVYMYISTDDNCILILYSIMYCPYITSQSYRKWSEVDRPGVQPPRPTRIHPEAPEWPASTPLTRVLQGSPSNDTLHLVEHCACVAMNWETLKAYPTGLSIAICHLQSRLSHPLTNSGGTQVSSSPVATLQPWSYLLGGPRSTQEPFHSLGSGHETLGLIAIETAASWASWSQCSIYIKPGGGSFHSLDPLTLQYSSYSSE